MTNIKLNDSYIAGFFDGDGTAMLSINYLKGRLPRFNMAICFYQKDSKILEMIREYLHLGKIYYPKAGSVPRLAIYGIENIKVLIERLINKSILKSKQLKVLKSYCELIEHKKRKAWSPCEWILAFSLFRKMRELNYHKRKNAYKYSVSELYKELEYYLLNRKGKRGWLKNAY